MARIFHSAATSAYATCEVPLLSSAWVPFPHSGLTLHKALILTAAAPTHYVLCTSHTCRVISVSIQLVSTFMCTTGIQRANSCACACVQLLHVYYRILSPALSGRAKLGLLQSRRCNSRIHLAVKIDFLGDSTQLSAAWRYNLKSKLASLPPSCIITLMSRLEGLSAKFALEHTQWFQYVFVR